MTSTILYVPLAEGDLEIRIELTAREYNGIDSDPSVTERQPTASELFAAVKAFSGSLPFCLHSTL